MNLRRHLLEAATLVAAAVLCAVVANALAGRERKLAAVGSYPAGLAAEAPPRAPTPVPPTASTAPSGPPTAPAEVARPAAPVRLQSRFPAHPDKPFVEVHGEDAGWLHARGALFLDARRTKIYEEGHVAGARPFSVWEADVDEKVVALLGEGRDPLEPVVVYCSGGDCEDSHMLTQKLWGAGFNNVLVYRDGWPDWQRRGGASRTGGKP